MTTNGTSKIGNYANVIYDTGNDAHNGKNRIGVSATEVEFLNDLPPPLNSSITSSGNSVSNQVRRFDTQASSSSIDKQKQQNNYQTLSVNRGQPKTNVVYQDEHNQQLSSAVDKLLNKYAPDANPPNILNTSNNRRSIPQVNVVTARDEPSFSTFQITAPSSSTASHNYSTIIRSNNGQMPQTQTQINPSNNNNNNNQLRTVTRPKSNYDSFQHVILSSPPQQQQQQQQRQQQQQQQQQQQRQPKKPVSVKNKDGTFTQVVPGKLYTLNDDPLYLLYDRQNVVPPNLQKPSTTTFQPSNNFQTNPDPLTVFYTNTSQRYPQQSIPTTTNTTSNGVQPFDLGNLIRRVQQDYLREIQPFVTSVKFVEKDREFGQGIADIGFTTPVTVRKGFTRQADDILRRSFGRPDGSRQPVNRNGSNTYPDDENEDDDDIDELRPLNRRPPLEKLDSKQSFTSVTSTSIDDSDYGENDLPENNRKQKVAVHDQGTSPPPQSSQTKTQSQTQHVPAASIIVPQKPTTKNETDEEETTTASQPVVPKLAKRISSDRRSLTSSGSITSNDQGEYSATYNEHEHPENSRARSPKTIHALVANAPIVKSVDEATRERSNMGNQGILRSEDIHPTPPTIRPSQVNSRPAVRSESEKSDSLPSGSDNVSESDDEDRSAAYNAQPQAPTRGRSNVPQVISSVPAGRDSNPPQANIRVPAGRDVNPPQANTRVPPGRDFNPPETNARVTTTTQNPPYTARTTTEVNPRQAVASGTNANLHFVPADQRGAANDRVTQPTTTNQAVSTGAAAQTGSTRFFQPDHDPKHSSKRSNKDAGSSIGDKIKSIFRRKKSG